MDKDDIAESGDGGGAVLESAQAVLSTSTAPSAHRLPTLTAAEALSQAAGAAEHGRDAVSLGGGAGKLDAILMQGRGATDVDGNEAMGTAASRRRKGGGVRRGAVTEVYGPPGVGKTALCIQAAAEALRSGEAVVWIDTATILPGRRLQQLLSSSAHPELSENSEEQSACETSQVREQLTRLAHYVAPTLAHLIALISHPPASFPPANTALLIVDCVSTPIDNAYPRGTETRRGSSKSDQAKWLNGRRQAIIAEVGSKLASIAAVRNIAVLLTTNTVTKVRVAEEALLRPAISGPDWDAAIETRLALFRDWVIDRGRNEQLKIRSSARFAELVKPKIAASDTLAQKLVVFHIDQGGLRESAELGPSCQSSSAKPETAKKRSHGEIDDSDEERSSEYGWNEADDELAADGLVDASFV